MKARNLGLVAALAGLSACAAMQPAPAGKAAVAQNAFYVVGDSAGSAQPAALAPDAQKQGASKLMRIYWFLGGR